MGHWEGDTMVIDVVNFTDETWISRNMPIHSDAMHVVESLKREGNTIQWKAVIEDPEVFTKSVTGKADDPRAERFACSRAVAVP